MLTLDILAQQLADALTQHLGLHFNHQSRLVRSFHLYEKESQRGLYFYFERWNLESDLATQRLKVSGCYPRGTGNIYYTPRDGNLPIATVSAGRAPSAIAHDIVRRVWQPYLPCYDKAVAYIAEHEAQLARQQSQRKLLVQIGDGFVSNGRETVYSRGGDIHWEARVLRNDRVDLKLNGLNIETACEILALLNGGAE